MCLCICLHFSSVFLFLLISLYFNHIDRLKLRRKNMLWRLASSIQKWNFVFNQKLIFSFEMFSINKELFCWLGSFRKKKNPLMEFLLPHRIIILNIFPKLAVYLFQQRFLFLWTDQLFPFSSWLLVPLWHSLGVWSEWIRIVCSISIYCFLRFLETFSFHRLVN